MILWLKLVFVLVMRMCFCVMCLFCGVECCLEKVVVVLCDCGVFVDVVV